MNFEQLHRHVNRRTFIGQSVAGGLGLAALATLLKPDLLRGQTGPARPAVPQWRGVVHPLHFAPKAKRVIWLYMAGGMSHLETFDYKPRLARLDRQPMPASYTAASRSPNSRANGWSASARSIRSVKCGQSGQEISSIFPHLATVADELCIIRSMQTEAINHDPAHTFMNTGSTISGRPAMGSWLQYGLGSECDNLPGFVVLDLTGRFGQAQPIAARQWHSGFLPSRFQGIEFRSTGEPVLYVTARAGLGATAARCGGRGAGMNRLHDRAVDDPEINTRIAPVRDGVSHADERAAVDEPGGRAATACWTSMALRGGGWFVRGELSVGPADGRARRALHPTLPSRLGPSRRH